MEKQITHKQHYVPRVYLRGFSADEQHIHFYNLLKKKYSISAVDVFDVCRERDLYEFKDNKGNLINANQIENIFSKMESMFSKEKNRLVRSAGHQSNYQRDAFFSAKSRCFWQLYCLLQVLRSPKLIKEEMALYEKMVGPNLIEAKNASLYFTLPFWGEIDESSKNAFCVLLKPMMPMSIAVGVIENDDELFTSDNPIYCYSKAFPCEEYDKIIFPVTTKICIFFWGNDFKEPNLDNKMFVMSNELIREIKWSIAYSADEFIFSKNRLSGSDRAVIREAHKLSEQDKKSKGEFVL